MEFLVVAIAFVVPNLPLAELEPLKTWLAPR